MDEMIAKLYTSDLVNKYSIKKTTEKTVIFKLVKPNENFDAIVINYSILEDQNYFSIILMRLSCRTGCFIEGVRKPIGGIFNNGWVVSRDNPEGVMDVLEKI